MDRTAPNSPQNQSVDGASEQPYQGMLTGHYKCRHDRSGQLQCNATKRKSSHRCLQCEGLGQ